MSDTEDPSLPPEELSPTQLEVWHRIVAQYGTPTAHVAHFVSTVANGVDSTQGALNEATGEWQEHWREVLQEQLTEEKFVLQVAQDAFAIHLWATRACADRDTADQIAEQLPKQFLAAWKTDHPGTPEQEVTPT